MHTRHNNGPRYAAWSADSRSGQLFANVFASIIQTLRDGERLRMALPSRWTGRKPAAHTREALMLSAGKCMIIYLIYNQIMSVGAAGPWWTNSLITSSSPFHVLPGFQGLIPRDSSDIADLLFAAVKLWTRRRVT